MGIARHKSTDPECGSVSGKTPGQLLTLVASHLGGCLSSFELDFVGLRIVSEIGNSKKRVYIWTKQKPGS